MRGGIRAAAAFHALSPARVPAGGLEAVSLQRLDQIAALVPDMAGACGELAAVLSAGPAHPFLHGDINTVNALWAGGDAPVGLVDLGEAQRGPVEIDLRRAPDIAAAWGGEAEVFIAAYADATGTQPDRHRLAAAFALNALGTLAIATLGTVRGLDAAGARATALVRLRAL